MYVCICKQVNERTISEAVRSGACSLDELGMELGVATGCGKCADAAREVIAATLFGEHPQRRFELARNAGALA